MSDWLTHDLRFIFLYWRWQRDRANIDLTEERVASRYSLLPSGTLEIQDIRFEDEGSYRCRVISPYGGMQELSREAELVLRRGTPFCIGSKKQTKIKVFSFRNYLFYVDVVALLVFLLRENDGVQGTATWCQSAELKFSTTNKMMVLGTVNMVDCSESFPKYLPWILELPRFS